MEQTVTISKKAYDDAIEAMEHCEKVFRSMSDRGAYPLELSPYPLVGAEIGARVVENKHFLGIQGFMFLIEASRSLRREYKDSHAKRVPQWGHEEKSILRSTMRFVTAIREKLEKFEFAEAKSHAVGAYSLLQKLATAVKMNGIEDEGE